VESIQKHGSKWVLNGKSGEAAFHDTSEKVANQAPSTSLGGAETCYDLVIMTDVSSSFDPWHRASAGLPQSFCKKVARQMGH
jgi:hypothetical protein